LNGRTRLTYSLDLLILAGVVLMVVGFGGLNVPCTCAFPNTSCSCPPPSYVTPLLAGGIIIVVGSIAGVAAVTYWPRRDERAVEGEGPLQNPQPDGGPS
jgi:hypothetical protein